MLGLGALLACETARVPASEVPASESAAAGASAVPAAGGAPSERNGGIGGDAPKPAGASGVGGNDTGSGGNDTGSGGSAGSGASGGSSGASGRDPDPSSGDERRYALWLGQTAVGNTSASPLAGD